MKIKRLLVIGLILAFNGLRSPATVNAFNLWTDFQQNLHWTLGHEAAAGIDIPIIGGGTIRYTQTLGVNEYRMGSLWYGTSDEKQSDGSAYDVKDIAKIGLNFAYLFRGFKEIPPAIVRNLVVGPTAETAVFSQFNHREPVDMGFDIALKVGGSTDTPTTAPVTVTAMQLPIGSRLSLLAYAGH